MNFILGRLLHCLGRASPCRWLLTHASLCYPPHVVAIAACHMAFTLHALDDEQWLARLQVRTDDVKALARALCQTYAFVERADAPLVLRTALDAQSAASGASSATPLPPWLTACARNV